ncbi:ABC transporter permease subunit [Actinoplanes awajinensis]|uniref:Transporter n=1 Tax=Actinoplanes awajinensis subsp. mycoplanecinus TaxID=135947 RepID=A0A101JC38_9ACTN|nr:ABC transporter permease subunit [Actinoplanes awajinensis]KUL24051.1 hypothetical protein ADL15_44570 [Actinoplanes awajinensis subsp. mycoplanecinus]
MIWLTWRQFRTPVLATGGLLLVLLAGMALTWTQVTDAALDAGFTGCQGADACAQAADTFLSALRYGQAKPVYYGGLATLVVLPAVVGIFWGAPLVARELETGTYRMVFSQSIGRGRWLLVKLLGGGLAAALGAGLVSLALGRWAHLIDAANGERILPTTFPARGVVPIGYAALAFVLGVTAGLLLRRTLTAMAVTLVVIAGLQLAVPLLVRPLLVTPTTTLTALDPTARMGMSYSMETKELRLEPMPEERDGWVLSTTVVTPSGTEFVGPSDSTKCGPEAPNERLTCPDWIAAQHLSTKLVYIPDAKFWTLQWREFGLLIVLTMTLSAFSVWWIRRRLA